MDDLEDLGVVLAGRGVASSRHIVRTALAAKEYQTIPLPPDVVGGDGSLELYDDVLKLFDLTYKDRKPALRCGGWVGYIPISDTYALNIDSRVPVSNMERVIERAGSYAPRVLASYTRYFGHTADQPQSLFDVVTDQFLRILDRIWREGLLKRYEQRTQQSASPSGRIEPFQTALKTQLLRKPMAVSSAFCRTVDCAPNRIIKLALEVLRYHYATKAPSMSGSIVRLRAIRQSLLHLSDVGHPTTKELSPASVVACVEHLPRRHWHYIDAIRIAQLLIANRGLAIRKTGSLVILPTLIIDMATVFEGYARSVLKNQLESGLELSVKDGNKGGTDGARSTLFTRLNIDAVDRPITPDIVVEKSERARLIIDVKYKPPRRIPDRSEISQVIGYGARYDCKEVMILYPGRTKDNQSVVRLGAIGEYNLYVGCIDLYSENLSAEEDAFCAAIANICGHDPEDSARPSVT